MRILRGTYYVESCSLRFLTLWAMDSLLPLRFTLVLLRFVRQRKLSCDVLNDGPKASSLSLTLSINGPLMGLNECLWGQSSHWAFSPGYLRLCGGTVKQKET